MTTATVPQHLSALEDANRIRWAMADRRREFKGRTFTEGCVLAAELIEEPPDDVVKRMKLGYLLRSVHRIGRSRATDIARLADASLSRRIAYRRGEYDAPPLSLRQRAVIAAELRRIAEGYGS